MTRIRVVFAAGKHTVPANIMADYLARLVDHEHADLFGTTESQQPHIAAAVRRKLGPTWAVGKTGEYLTGWRQDRFLNLPAYTRLRHVTAVAGLVKWRNFRVSDRRFKLRGHRARLRFMLGHAPSAVQAGPRYRKDRPRIVKASRQGFHRLGQLLRQGKRRARRVPLTQMVFMDSNLDQHMPVWRDFLTEQLGAESVWSHRVPRQGTHGTRLIDTGHVAGGRVVGSYVSVFPKPAGLDHAPIVVAVDLPD